MERSEIRARVYTRVASTTDDPMLTTAIVNDLINDALREISSDGEWTWLNLATPMYLVANTYVYDLPAGFMEIVSLTQLTGEVLTPVSDSDIDALSTLDFGTPMFYNITNNQIILMPIPLVEMTLLLRYRGADNVLVNDADEPKLPEHLIDALIWYTCYLCMIVTRDDERASDMFNNYQLARKRMENRATQSSDVPRLKRRPGGFLD